MQPGRKICVSIFLVLTMVVACSAQSPGSSVLPANATVQRTYPAPTNLKVLPKDMTGQQVHELMEQWRVELGVRCSACHGEDQDHVVPAGPRQSKFSDDSEPMKGIARLMYTMTEQINRDFIAKIEGSEMPVTCGTCHRGRVSPEPVFVAPAVPPSIKTAQHP